MKNDNHKYKHHNDYTDAGFYTTDEDRKAAELKISEKSNFYRGDFLTKFSGLEAGMNYVITAYFFERPNKKRDYFNLLFLSDKGLQIHFKKRIVWFIINQYPKLFKQHRSVDENIGKLINFRNILAHSSNVIYENNLGAEKEIIVRYETIITENDVPKIDTLVVTEQRYNEYVSTLEKVRKLLFDFHDFLWEEKLPPKSPIKQGLTPPNSDKTG